MLGYLERSGQVTSAETLSGAVPPDRLAAKIQILLDKSRIR
jgi:hypothetical protein